MNYNYRKIYSVVSIFAFLMTCFVLTPCFAQDHSLFNIGDAQNKGVFNIGLSQGSEYSGYDEIIKKNVLKFDYSAPPGTMVGVWTKDFPEALSAASVNTLRIGVKAEDPEQLRQISVNLEIKGTENVQNIPLSLKAGWNSIVASINWDLIGQLKEVVFVLRPQSDSGESVTGTLSLDLDFLKLKAQPERKAPAEAALPFNIMAAQERGIFNIGQSQGSVDPVFDESLNKDILNFNYAIPKDTIVGVWTKEFPSDLNADAVNAVKIQIKVPENEQVKQISMKVEIKGTKEVQIIQPRLEPGWNAIEELIEWEMIGELREVVFVALPTGNYESVAGQLLIDLDFIKATVKPKTSPTTSPRHDDLSAYNIMTAAKKGVFNIGNAQGGIAQTFDEAANQDGLKFNYTAAKDTLIGVWTKGYPEQLGPEKANAVNIGLRVPEVAQAKEVSVIVEIKGTKDKQDILVPFNSGWNTHRVAIHWDKIGDLREVVFIVKPKGITDSVTGTMNFYMDFGKLRWMETVAGKIGLVLLLALILTLLSVFLGRIFKRRSAEAEPAAAPVDKEIPAKVNLKLDFIYGPAAILIVGVAVGIYWLGTSLGTTSPQNICISFLVMAVTGALIAQLLKAGLTGKNLTPVEVFQNIMLTGLLAATSSNQVLLQAPATWTQVLMKSNLIAMIAFLVYHISNAFSLARTRKHIKPITGVLIVGTPYLFGWLLLLQNSSLLQTLGSGLTVGLFAAWPGFLEGLGRVLIVFGFNEALINGISLATRGKLLNTRRVHLLTFLVSLGVVLSPTIANLGSSEAVGSLPLAVTMLIALITTIFAHAGLWGEVYLITGVTLDGTRRISPSSKTILDHVSSGMRKGMVYSGILMTILYLLKIILDVSVSQLLMKILPISVGMLAGALVFPLIKTIIETFDGSQAFIARMRYSYRNITLYCRGAVVGFGFAFMINQELFQLEMSDRIMFGTLIGLIASLGVSFFRDAVYALRGCGRIQSWRLYFVDSLLGTFVGGAAAFYMDSSQVPVVIEKFKLYTTAGFASQDYITFPLVNKWGRIDLGAFTGGVRLLFTESLAGVINWAVAAWLFAINRAFIAAIFQKEKAPIKFLFSRAGFVELIKHMIQVLRWGLWMSPIIFTFLRMMDTPTWYNQDGAIRSLVAIYQNISMGTAEFQAWSLKLFVYLLAFDLFRVLIWIDHMGLRVATLVNLSFIGLDKLDEKIARFIGPAAAQRYIPEAVKRFATWAPLLIPFYLPRGQNWDYAWRTSEAMQNAAGNGGLIFALKSLSVSQIAFMIGFAMLMGTGISFLLRALGRRSRKQCERTYELSNGEYRVVLKDSGETYSNLVQKDYDISRRSYDTMDPSGRMLFLVDDAQESRSSKLAWPVIGNFPRKMFAASRMESNEASLKVENTNHGIKTSIDITLPEPGSSAELWTMTIQNLTDKPRQIKVVPYLEWVLCRALDDRFHPQYSRLFPEMEYTTQANAVLAWHKKTKYLGILASDKAPEGFLTSRMDFIGRARSIWEPWIFNTMNFQDARDSEACPTFDPIGSLIVSTTIAPKSSANMRFLIGVAKDKTTAIDLVGRCLKPQAAKTTRKMTPANNKKKSLLIGHGEIMPNTPQPYFEYSDNGDKLQVLTPYTPRPFDHAMSNAAGHTVIVTNRGLHTTCNGNSQQNRLTPDGPDTVTRETPGEAIYLYEPDQDQWYCPTHHPLNDYSAKNEVEFGVDGTAVFRMTRGTIATELTVFVPPDDPLGVYLLKIRNNSKQSRRMRIVPFFQMVLELQPERSGELLVQHDKEQEALFFENPRNSFRSGSAFVSMSIPAKRVETKRGRFFGSDRAVNHPFMAETGKPDCTQVSDNRSIASFVGYVDIPAGGESTMAIIMGQTDDKKQAEQLVRKYKKIETVQKRLDETRRWWLRLMSTVKLRTNNHDFDQMQNWLKYQAVVERLWARRGFYQSSGAYGFRDQLQDTVNLMWVDPALARKQIILHASQQFIEGDVCHWFFTLTDGRTAFACRSHASDNLLWLAWGVVEYINATGDESVLNEMTSYVTSENPFQPLPKNKSGWGDLYHRSTRADSVYRHCLRAIDLVLDKRMGKNGLPLIGTGDWNDGLDEIGSEGRGESVWLGLFLYHILKNMTGIIEKQDGFKRKQFYADKLQALGNAIEQTWRDDRYLRAIHDDGTEIGIKDSGVWEIDALTAAWAVMSGINVERGITMFHTALRVLERENVILLGWPALSEDTKPYLGRSSSYPEGVRENGMYCHGVQWLIKAARVLAEQFEAKKQTDKANEYRAIAYRLWMKITPITHTTSQEIELYGGQPNKQPADLLTTFDQGRMIWNGYTGAAGWLFHQAMAGVVGASLRNNQLVLPKDIDKPRGKLKVNKVDRNVSLSPLAPYRNKPA